MRIGKRKRQMDSTGCGEGASTLPDDVLFEIQARLPIVSLVRSRAVCKTWKEAVDSPNFLVQERLKWRARTGVGAREHMLLVVGFRLGESERTKAPAMAMVSSAYDPASDRWYELQVGPGLWWYEPEPIRTHYYEVNPHSGLRLVKEEHKGHVQLTRASLSPGVLLARSCRDARTRENKVFIHIGNPLAGSWASLPKLPGELCMYHLCGVLVDTVARRLKVVMAESRLAPLRPLVPIVPVGTSTFVFDSALGAWTRTSTDIPLHDDFHAEAGEGVFIRNVLYCLTVSCNLLAYDLEAARWTHLRVGNSAVFLSDVHHSTLRLVSVQDRLLCTAFHSEDHMLNRLQIWEVDLASTAWKVVDFMLMHPYKDIARLYVCSVVAAPDDVVYIMRESEERQDEITIVAVDFRQKLPTWRLLPCLRYNGFTRKSLYCFDPWLQFGTWDMGSLHEE